MKKSQFESRLKRAVAWDQIPQLSQDEVDDLVELAKTRDNRGFAPEDVSEWEPRTHYNVGEMVVNPYKETFICVSDGVSDSYSPRFARNQVGEYVDGTAHWVYQGKTNYKPTYDLNRAAYEGWGMKAGKASSMYSISADGARYDRNQIIEHCERMQKKYSVNTSVKLRSGGTRIYPMILEVSVDD